MVKINWTEISLVDMKDLYGYISKDSVYYATITVNKIYNRVNILTRNPRIGRVIPEINDGLVRELVEGNYRIIYRILSEQKIDILRIYHSARLLKDL